MEENNGFGFGSLLLAFLTGATAGGVVALLTAQESGAATRKRLSAAGAKASALPLALKTAALEAGGAAKDAFIESYNESEKHSANGRHHPKD